jgi:hypothetical protein
LQKTLTVVQSDPWPAADSGADDEVRGAVALQVAERDPAPAAEGEVVDREKIVLLDE